MSAEHLVDITNDAIHKIDHILEQQPGGTHFRIQIKGGGCSGFEYVFGIDDSIKTNDRFQQIKEIIHQKECFFMVLIDDISIQYIKSSKIDFVSDTNGERFVVTNPNAGTSCSCGSSFSRKEETL